jgi:hypothetical protein
VLKEGGKKNDFGAELQDFIPPKQPTHTLCNEQILHRVGPDKVELESQAADLEVVDDHAFEDPGQMLVPENQ